jgi:hypothetical protein
MLSAVAVEPGVQLGAVNRPAAVPSQAARTALDDDERESPWWPDMVTSATGFADRRSRTSASGFEVPRKRLL